MEFYVGQKVVLTEIGIKEFPNKNHVWTVIDVGGYIECLDESGLLFPFLPEEIQPLEEDEVKDIEWI